MYKIFVQLFLLFIFSIILVSPVKAVEDSDQDLLSNEEEVYFGTDPNKFDSDGDGFGDGTEVRTGFSPLKANIKLSKIDSDSDGLNDWIESKFKSSLWERDTDGDGKSDYVEIMAGNDPLSTSSKKFTQKIIVDRTTQRLKYLVNNVQVKEFKVSTGLPTRQTPAGTYKIFQKIQNMRYVGSGYNYPNVRWNMHFIPNYFIHTAYWHNDFGIRPRSSGCINMREQDAKFLYNNVSIGTEVEVTGKTPLKKI